LQIYRLIQDRGLTHAEAGKILGIQQPHVSALMRGQSGAFSIERLMDILTALGEETQEAFHGKLPKLAAQHFGDIGLFDA